MGFGCPGTGVTDRCELPCGFWEEQPPLLTAEHLSSPAAIPFTASPTAFSPGPRVVRALYSGLPRNDKQGSLRHRQAWASFGSAETGCGG